MSIKMSMGLIAKLPWLGDNEVTFCGL